MKSSDNAKKQSVTGNSSKRLSDNATTPSPVS